MTTKVETKVRTKLIILHLLIKGICLSYVTSKWLENLFEVSNKKINRYITDLKKAGFIDSRNLITDKGTDFYSKYIIDINLETQLIDDYLEDMEKLREIAYIKMNEGE